MKKIFLYIVLCTGVSGFFWSCDRNEDIDSVAQDIILPFISEKLMNDAYVYGVGNATLLADLPDTVAIAVDTVFGMVGGTGGKTGKDNLYILKDKYLSLPDLSKIGGSSIRYEAFSNGGYKVSVSSNVVVAGPISDPGPTDLAGSYDRINATTGAPTGYVLEIKKVFDGVYIVGNPGGAASVPNNPYLLYNHTGDVLSFAIQEDLCHGGLRLVSPTAPGGLTALEYDAYPPIIEAGSNPLTLRWKVFEFPSPTTSALHPDAALCNWGLGQRIFRKK